MSGCTTHQYTGSGVGAATDGRTSARVRDAGRQLVEGAELLGAAARQRRVDLDQHLLVGLLHACRPPLAGLPRRLLPGGGGRGGHRPHEAPGADADQQAARGRHGHPPPQCRRLGRTMDGGGEGEDLAGMALEAAHDDVELTLESGRA